ncbi:MAG: hypothetical protein AAFR81_13770 [Chloroflexota bacterium]
MTQTEADKIRRFLFQWAGGKGAVITAGCVLFLIGLLVIFVQADETSNIQVQAYWWGMLPFALMGIGVSIAEKRALVAYRGLEGIRWIAWSSLAFFAIFALQLWYHNLRIPEQPLYLRVVSAYLLPYSYPAYFIGIAGVQAFLLRKYYANPFSYMIPAVICAPISVLVPFPAVCLYLVAGAYNVKNNLADYEPLFVADVT